MKKIFIMAIAAVFALASCEDQLDSANYTAANTSNYPASPGDLNKELAALYGVMNQMSTDPLQTPWLTMLTVPVVRVTLRLTLLVTS